MDKGALLVLNPETTKASTKKLSIETKISLTQPTAIPQSTKSSSKPAAISSTHRLIQYQRQANNLRSTNAAAGAKRIAAKGKKTNRTTINQSGSKQQVTDNSIRNSSIENIRQEAAQPRATISKDRQISNKTLQDSPVKGWCVLNSSVSTGQPISVNINISNHVMAPESGSKASPAKVNNTTLTKKSAGILNTSTLGRTQPVKGISGKTHVETPKVEATRKVVIPSKTIPMKPVRKDHEKYLSNPKIETVKKQQPIVSSKTNLIPKPSVQISQIQDLLKAVATPKAQTQRFSLGCTDKTKKPEPKPTQNTTVIHIQKQQPPQPQQQKQSSSQSTLTSSLRFDSKLKPVPSPKKNVEVAKTFPMTPAQTLKAFGDRLTDYEKGEIIDYDSIYFIGSNNGYFKTQNGKKGREDNFDDDKGDYNAYVGDQIGYRYEIIDMLGKGSFGQAIKCKDHKTGEMVALKIIRSKKRFYHQATVEVKILKYIKDHDTKNLSNVVQILDFFTFRKHICIVFELLSINLYDFIKENNFKGLSLGLIRKFAIQILQSLVLLREHSIIHCDLKPENILLKQPNKSGIKLIDFGSSCFSHEKIYTYIQSRFYRAPEIMLAIPYTTSIDMWSFGCILAELFTGFPIFPGESEPEQMALIMEINGLPPKTMLDKATRKEVFFDSEGKPLPGTNSREGGRVPATKTLSSVLKCTDVDFIDFLRKCFVWEPEKRIVPEDALAHPWISKVFPQLAAHNSRAEEAKMHYTVQAKDSEETKKHYSTNPKEAKEGKAQYATQSKDSEEPAKVPKASKSKPSLNQSLVGKQKTTMQSASNLVGFVATPKTVTNKETVSKEMEQSSKLQERLLQLRAKLKVMTTSNTGSGRNAGRPDDKKNTAINMTEDPKASAKRGLKQSNIF